MNRRVSLALACGVRGLALGSILLLGALRADAAAVYEASFDHFNGSLPDLSGQFSVVIGRTTSGYDFTFANAGPVESSITRIYLEDTFSTFLDFGAFSSDDYFHSSGSPWRFDKVRPANVPGGNSIQFSPDFISGASNPSPHNGVRPGEFITFSFLTVSGFQEATFLDALATDGLLRMALQVQSQGDAGTSAQYLSTTGSFPPGVNDPDGGPDPAVVPVPPAVGMGLAGLVLVGLARKAKARLMPATK